MLIYALRGVLWNLFLAFLPVLLAYVVVWSARRARKQPVMYVPAVALFFVWLGFLPNSCYLLTEWRHFLMTLDGTNLYLRAHTDPATLVFLTVYTAFYFCYSAVGMFAFTLALRPLARIARKYVPSVWVAAVPLFVMLSLGVYLGLVLRDNTWDLLVRPANVWMHIVAVGARPMLIAAILAFGAFLWVAYLAIDIWIDAFLIRFCGRPASLLQPEKQA